MDILYRQGDKNVIFSFMVTAALADSREESHFLVEICRHFICVLELKGKEKKKKPKVMIKHQKINRHFLFLVTTFQHC